MGPQEQISYTSDFLKELSNHTFGMLDGKMDKDQLNPRCQIIGMQSKNVADILMGSVGQMPDGEGETLLNLLLVQLETAYELRAEKSSVSAEIVDEISRSYARLDKYFQKVSQEDSL